MSSDQDRLTCKVLDVLDPDGANADEWVGLAERISAAVIANVETVIRASGGQAWTEPGYEKEGTIWGTVLPRIPQTHERTYVQWRSSWRKVKP